MIHQNFNGDTRIPWENKSMGEIMGFNEQSHGFLSSRSKPGDRLLIYVFGVSRNINDQ
jgi:hypothetical protein